jgi:iron-sulfur cluster assembly accessory protein
MISVTAEAQRKLEEVLEARGSVAAPIRVGVVRGPHGCVHGWRLGIDESPRSEDIVLTFGPVQLLIEPSLSDTLEGAVIDYREDATGIGFTIDAPNTPQREHDGGCGHH